MGDVRNELGFPDPNRVFPGITLDIPVDEAVRRALVAELKTAGYREGDGDLLITAAVQSLAFGNAAMITGTAQIAFKIQSKKDAWGVPYEKTCVSNRMPRSIFDTNGILAQLRECIVRFLSDPQTVAVLDGRAAPSGQRTAAKAAPAWYESSEAAPAADAVAVRNPSRTEPAPSRPSRLDAPPFKLPEHPDDWALVVGVENYRKNLPKADFAERDAEAVRAYLAALGVPEQNVISLVGQDATQSAIKSYLEDYLPKNATPNSRVFFYFSGHGAPDPESGSAYLVPWEAEPQFIKTQGLPLGQLYGDLAKLKAKQVLVAMDCCFSGAGGRSVLAKGTRPLVNVRTSANLAPNMAVLAAAGGDQVTGVLDEEGHGLFTYHLLKGLAEGKRDAKSLYDFLKPGVEKAARRQNNIQIPVFEGANLSF